MNSKKMYDASKKEEAHFISAFNRQNINTDLYAVGGTFYDDIHHTDLWIKSKTDPNRKLSVDIKTISEKNYHVCEDENRFSITTNTGLMGDETPDYFGFVINNKCYLVSGSLVKEAYNHNMFFNGSNGNFMLVDMPFIKSSYEYIYILN